MVGITNVLSVRTGNPWNDSTTLLFYEVIYMINIYKSGLLADIEADIAEGKIPTVTGNTLIRYIMNHEPYANRILWDSLSVNGEDRQIRKLMEEMSELQEAILKHMDNRDTVEHVAEEIADVFIMLQQMVLLRDCADEVTEWYKFKINRMDERNRKAIEKFADWLTEMMGVHDKCPR